MSNVVQLRQSSLNSISMGKKKAVILRGKPTDSMESAIYHVGVYLAINRHIMNQSWSRIAAEVNRDGYRTTNGKPFTGSYLCQHKGHIYRVIEECDSAWLGGKPRIRVATYRQ